MKHSIWSIGRFFARCLGRAARIRRLLLFVCILQRVYDFIWSLCDFPTKKEKESNRPLSEWLYQSRQFSLFSLFGAEGKMRPEQKTNLKSRRDDRYNLIFVFLVSTNHRSRPNWKKVSESNLNRSFLSILPVQFI